MLMLPAIGYATSWSVYSVESDKRRLGATAFGRGFHFCPDGKRFERLDTGGPWVKSPFGSVRYVYGLRVEDQVFFYYEYTREDGSHDLRVSVVTP